ncbi:hypothetical protein GQ457_09G023630 [Hibiscus cannabinus]
MANTSTLNSSSSHTSDFSFDVSSSPITSYKLNGSNYLSWSQSVRLYITGHRKADYLLESTPVLASSDAGYTTWVSENNTIMAWLINSMVPDIGENFMLYRTAVEICTAARDTYSNTDNIAELFGVENQILELRQADLPLGQYFGQLTKCWQHIDLYEVPEWKCPDDAKVYGTLKNQKRVFQFLSGLSDDLDAVRGRILATKPLPSVREAFSEVQREESRWGVMLPASQPADGSAFLTHARSGSRSQKGRPWCDYCKKLGHLRDRCWKLHGKPSDGKPLHHPPSRDSPVAMVAPPGSVSTFSSDQLRELQYLFSHLALPKETAAVTISEGSHCFISSSVSSPWILDLGASDHMTCNLHLLHDYQPSGFSSSIRTADGSLSQVQGRGSLTLATGLVLSNVLFVPKLAYNLLSASPTFPILAFEPDLDPSPSWPSPTPIIPSATTDLSTTRCLASPLLTTPPFQSTRQPLTQNWPLSVYSRRKTHDIVQPSLCQKLDLTHGALEDEASSPQVSASYVDKDSLPIALRKGVRQCSAHPIERFVAYGNLTSPFKAFTTTVDSVQIPKNVQEAFKDPAWKKAVEEELLALQKKKNSTWSLTELPKGKRTVGCKWVFAVKFHSDGSIERFKARLVAKGFTQSYGVDYQETFAPVAKLNTIRVLLSLAVNKDWELHQLDIKNAFLNGTLEEEVYMEVPPSLEGPSTLQKVCKLNKSLYMLKQSPRAWFDRFSKAILKYGFTQSQADHTLFRKVTPNGMKAYLGREFETKDLGSLRYFLGMEVARSNEGNVINQRKYVLDLLKETGMLGCKPIDTPMDPNLEFGRNESNIPVSEETYQRLVGKLIYLSLTRPDLAYSVGIVSQFMSDPKEEHLEAVYRILKYLKFTPGFGLMFRKTSDRSVKVYTDSRWTGNLTDRKSTSGYCSFVWGNLVTWRSKNQVVVAWSSAESEYRAMALGICEGMWLKRLLAELYCESGQGFDMLSDSQSIISIAKYPVQHDRTKHVEIDRHFIYENVNSGAAKLHYVPTKHQLADALTKALPRTVFKEFTFKLGIYNVYIPADFLLE